MEIKLSFAQFDSVCLLTNADSDEEPKICEHLPQHVSEVPFSAAVAVLHQLSSPQSCKGGDYKSSQHLKTQHAYR